MQNVSADERITWNSEREKCRKKVSILASFSWTCKIDCLVSLGNSPRAGSKVIVFGFFFFASSIQVRVNNYYFQSDLKIFRVNHRRVTTFAIAIRLKHSRLALRPVLIVAA